MSSITAARGPSHQVQPTDKLATDSGAANANLVDAARDERKPAALVDNAPDQDPKSKATAILTDGSRTPAQRAEAVKTELSGLPAADRAGVLKDALAGLIARPGNDINPVARVKEEKAVAAALVGSGQLSAEDRSQAVKSGLERARTSVDGDVVTAMEALYANSKAEGGASPSPAKESTPQAGPQPQKASSSLDEAIKAAEDKVAAGTSATKPIAPAKPASSLDEAIKQAEAKAAAPTNASTPTNDAKPALAAPKQSSEAKPSSTPSNSDSLLDSMLQNVENKVKEASAASTEALKAAGIIQPVGEKTNAAPSEQKAAAGPQTAQPKVDGSLDAKLSAGAAASEPTTAAQPSAEAKPSSNGAAIAASAEAVADQAIKPATTASPASGLSESMRARASELGSKLAQAYSPTSMSYREAVLETQTAMARAERDAKKNGETFDAVQFKEAVAKTFMEKAIRANEKSLADHSEGSNGHEIEREIRYDIGSKLVGEKRASALIREVSADRVKEILSVKSTYQDGADVIAAASGLARRTGLPKQDEAIAAEREEIKASALDDIGAVLDSDSLELKEKADRISAIMDRANRGPGESIENKDLAETFKAYAEKRAVESRKLSPKRRAAAIGEVAELAEDLDQEKSPAVVAALGTMKSELGAELLKDSVPSIIADKHLSWAQTAQKLEDLRSEVVKVSGMKAVDVNHSIEDALKKYLTDREVDSLHHAKELMNGIKEVAVRLELASAAEEEMRRTVREKVRDDLEALTLKERAEVDKLITTEDARRDLDDREKAARRYIADVAQLGDKELEREVTVKLGAHAVEKILESELPIKTTFEERADEAQDLARTLDILPEAAQTVALVAERRFADVKGTPEELASKKNDLYELMEEFDLRPQDTRDSKSELKKDATERLQKLDRSLDEGLVAAAREAEEEARQAAAARKAKAYSEIEDLLNRDDLPIEKRISEVKAITRSNTLDQQKVKGLVSAKVDALADAKDKKSTRNAVSLAEAFGIEME